ncbi:glutathione S-transferase [Neolentinus lepideus HHB14362 ss-1]|uniref:glutathione transferase n=1 Tax=Neolentinus lepideus HHB14362 ss-1 TaxID=1314782 RepID=A0A165VPJ5_9AGAM|nr:glutathione S-transferase [Neolentinus lepideus HHB14362 ss-1]
MAIKLYGNLFSPCTQLVVLVCKELDIEYELIVLNLTGDQKKPEYVDTLQPFGQLPALDDNGFILYESRAIACYLTAKAGSPLYPTKEVKALSKYEQAASVEICNFDQFVTTIAWEKIYKAYAGLKTDDARVEEYATTLSGKLDGYEKILSKQRFVAGDNLTLADLFHLPYGALLSQCGYPWLENGKRPNVARWWKEISGRESWQAVKDAA